MKSTGKQMIQRRIQRYGVLSRIRKRQEEVKANILAVAQRRTLAARDQLAAIEREQNDWIQRAHDDATSIADVQLLNNYMQYERHLGRLAVEKGSGILELEEEASAKRHDLHEALKQRRMIDRLIERAEENLQDQMNRQEQWTLDETATIRAAASRALRIQKGGNER